MEEQAENVKRRLEVFDKNAEQYKKSKEEIEEELKRAELTR